jgi:hypothetical protein
MFYDVFECLNSPLQLMHRVELGVVHLEVFDTASFV